MALPRIIRQSALLWAFGALMAGSAQDRPQNDRPGRPERPHERSERQDKPKRREEPRERPARESQRPEPPRMQEDRRGGHILQPPPYQVRQNRERQEDAREQHHRPDMDNPGGTRLRSEGPPQRSREQARGWEQHRGWRSEGAWGEHHSWQEHRARRWEDEHRSWGQRGGYGGYFIPESQFRMHFGNQHWFRLRTRPSIYHGYPRFQHGGFWFTLVDPWPEFWSETWYSNDDVYLDYDDGYYLYNRRHPGIAIAVTASF